MSGLTIGDQVRVLRTRVHPHPGRVIELLPVRVRVEFPTGGYGGTSYVEEFALERLAKVGEEEANVIAVGQVWQRKPAGYLYRVAEAGDSDFAQDIVLHNLHESRISRISAPGLRAKFIRRGDLDGK